MRNGRETKGKGGRLMNQFFSANRKMQARWADDGSRRKVARTADAALKTMVRSVIQKNEM
jgi:IS4 transposase